MSAPEIELVTVADAATRTAAAALIREYLGWIQREAVAHYGLDFDIEAMLASDMQDEAKFYAPHGRFYLAMRDANPVGVGCLKRLERNVAEIQRMYVQPRARGASIARLLLEKLLADCREMQFSIVRLESLRFLSAAHALYRSAGFVEVQPYGGSSMLDYQADTMQARYRASAVFMELRL